MKKIIPYCIGCILASFLRCSFDNQQNREYKIHCYSKKLEVLKGTDLYQKVMAQFADTFQVLKTDYRYFGNPDVVENKIDEAIFFNHTNSKCLLIVLQRSNGGLVFGNARIIHGKYEKDRWSFKVGMDYSYSNDFHDKYFQNTFEHLSLIARYSVLSFGKTVGLGCEIDENAWFEEQHSID